jgi:hypothetical protein
MSNKSKKMKYIQMLSTLLIVLIIIIGTINFFSNNGEINVSLLSNSNIFNFDNDRIEPSLKVKESPYLNLDSKIHYLYWTGGYDSTYRLCEMLIVEKKKVQPIYISLPLDNDCVTEEACNKLWVRRNRKEEKNAMKKIIEKLHKDFPYTKRTLLPTLEVKKEISDSDFNMKFEDAFYSNNLWPRKRKKHQYLFLSKFAYYHKKFIDIGVLGIHKDSIFGQYLKKNLIEKNNNLYLKDINHPLGYLLFPLYGRSKEDLLELSKKYKFEHVLKITWSCWFPKNGKPCGKCPMCRERII